MQIIFLFKLELCLLNKEVNFALLHQCRMFIGIHLLWEPESWFTWPPRALQSVCRGTSSGCLHGSTLSLLLYSSSSPRYTDTVIFTTWFPSKSISIIQFLVALKKPHCNCCYKMPWSVIQVNLTDEADYYNFQFIYFINDFKGQICLLL